MLRSTSCAELEVPTCTLDFFVCYLWLCSDTCYNMSAFLGNIYKICLYLCGWWICKSGRKRLTLLLSASIINGCLHVLSATCTNWMTEVCISYPRMSCFLDHKLILSCLGWQCLVPLITNSFCHAIQTILNLLMQCHVTNREHDGRHQEDSGIHACCS